MKNILLASVAAFLFVTGCSQSDSSSQTGTSTNSSAISTNLGMMQPVVDYYGNMAKAKQTAGKTVDVASLNQAIGLFQVDKGRLPSDLDELVKEGYLKKIPDAPYGTKIDYDPT